MTRGIQVVIAPPIAWRSSSSLCETELLDTLAIVRSRGLDANDAVRPSDRDHGEVGDAEDQIQPDRRQPRRATSLELLARQESGREKQLPHRAEHPPVHVEQLVGEFADDVAQSRIEWKRFLTALRAERAVKLRRGSCDTRPDRKWRRSDGECPRTVPYSGRLPCYQSTSRSWCPRRRIARRWPRSARIGRHARAPRTRLPPPVPTRTRRAPRSRTRDARRRHRTIRADMCR